MTCLGHYFNIIISYCAVKYLYSRLYILHLKKYGLNLDCMHDASDLNCSRAEELYLMLMYIY